jgi:peptidoglycan/xylan/chitin deacetylase (PgdA/CDA1 family)
LTDYPRDMVGYGRNPPDPRWPGGAAIAVQFVLNYEEGAENSVLDGDAASETFLSEITPAEPFADRHMSMESLYEYGSRAGLWRLLTIFERHDIPLTVFAVARAMQRDPDAVTAFTELGHEIACHGLRWKSYQLIDRDTERAHMAEAVQILRDLTGGPRAAGTQGAIRRLPGNSSSNTAASSTTPTRTPTTSPTGCACTTRATWWCPTRPIPTTCGLPQRPDSQTAMSS